VFWWHRTIFLLFIFITFLKRAAMIIWLAFPGEFEKKIKATCFITFFMNSLWFSLSPLLKIKNQVR